jgi:hypothetical protein
MTTPKPGDIVKVTLTGEVMDKNGTGAEGYLWLQVQRHGPMQIPIEWAHVIKEAPPKKENGHG